MANIWIPYNLFELRDEEVIAAKIITVNYATYAVAERKPEKIQACRDSNPYVCDTQMITRPDLLVNQLLREDCCLSTEQQSWSCTPYEWSKPKLNYNKYGRWSPSSWLKNDIVYSQSNLHVWPPLASYHPLQATTYSKHQSQSQSLKVGASRKRPPPLISARDHFWGLFFPMLF